MHFGRLAAVALPLLLSAPVLAQAPTPAPQKPCCFANPSYTGVCEVTPIEGETCREILLYLNNPQASGKSYCNATDIRKDWTLRDCAAPAPRKDKDKPR